MSKLAPELRSAHSGLLFMSLGWVLDLKIRLVFIEVGRRSPASLWLAFHELRLSYGFGVGLVFSEAGGTSVFQGVF